MTEYEWAVMSDEDDDDDGSIYVAMDEADARYTIGYWKRMGIPNPYLVRRPIGEWERVQEEHD